MSKLKINPEFKNLIPPLQEDEYKTLEQNILADSKVRDALVLWRGTLIDGHNRYEIATKHSLPYEVMEKEFEDEDAVMLWIIDNQLGRRNVPPFAMIELAQQREPLFRAMSKKRQGARNDLNIPQVPAECSSNRHERETNVQLAKLAKVSRGTYEQAKKIIKKDPPPEILQELREGKRSIHATERELRVGSKVCEFCGEEKRLSRFPVEGSKKCLDCKGKKVEKLITSTPDKAISGKVAENPQVKDVELAAISEDVDNVEGTGNVVSDDTIDDDNEESKERKEREAFEDVEDKYEDSEESDVPDIDIPDYNTPDLSEKIPKPTPQLTNKRSIADIALGTPSSRTVNDSKEYRDALQKTRDNVKQMAEYSRSHKRTIEEFQQVFQANAERLVDSIKHQFKFMDAETWADPANKQIACYQLDELVQAITNFKEEFLTWK